MSHFVLMMIGKDVEEQLRPYKEEADDEFMEFCSMEKSTKRNTKTKALKW